MHFYQSFKFVKDDWGVYWHRFCNKVKKDFSSLYLLLFTIAVEVFFPSLQLGYSSAGNIRTSCSIVALQSGHAGSF